MTMGIRLPRWRHHLVAPTVAVALIVAWATLGGSLARAIIPPSQPYLTPCPMDIAEDGTIIPCGICPPDTECKLTTSNPNGTFRYCFNPATGWIGVPTPCN